MSGSAASVPIPLSVRLACTHACPCARSRRSPPHPFSSCSWGSPRFSSSVGSLGRALIIAKPALAAVVEGCQRCCRHLVAPTPPNALSQSEGTWGDISPGTTLPRTPLPGVQTAYPGPLSRAAELSPTGPRLAWAGTTLGGTHVSQPCKNRLGLLGYRPNAFRFKPAGPNLTK
jgi:hypothetical protein